MAARRNWCYYCFRTLDPQDERDELGAFVECSDCNAHYHIACWGDCGKCLRCGEEQEQPVQISSPSSLRVVTKTRALLIKPSVVVHVQDDAKSTRRTFQGKTWRRFFKFFRIVTVIVLLVLLGRAGYEAYWNAWKSQHYQQGMDCLADAEWVCVQTELEKVWQRDPKHKDVERQLKESYYQVSKVYTKAEEWDKARIVLEKLIELDSDYKDAQALRDKVKQRLASTKVTPTPTRVARVTPTPTRVSTLVNRTPLSGPSFPLKITPVAVSSSHNPLAIDFLIDDIEPGQDTIRFDITIKRRTSSSLSWTSDENRKSQIHLTSNSHQYKLIRMGGIFIQNTSLQPGQSYKGWFVFEKPKENTFTFHYPDVKPVPVELPISTFESTP